MDANGSSLSVAQRLTPKASPFRTPSRNRAKPSGPAPGAAAGFLLLDSSLRPLSFNTEAIRVLGYPDTPANVRRPDVFLAGKIRARLMSESASRESPLVAEFRSGRRRYSCRAFLVDAHANGSSHARIAVLLERSPSGLIPLLGLVETQEGFTQSVAGTGTGQVTIPYPVDINNLPPGCRYIQGPPSRIKCNVDVNTQTQVPGIREYASSLYNDSTPVATTFCPNTTNCPAASGADQCAPPFTFDPATGTCACLSPAFIDPSTGECRGVD